MTSPVRGAPPQPGGGKRKGKAQYVQAKRARRGPGGGPRQLAPAMQGILITCNMNERKCVEEAYSLLSEYGDDLFGPEKVWPWGGWPGSSPPGRREGRLPPHACASGGEGARPRALPRPLRGGWWGPAALPAGSAPGLHFSSSQVRRLPLRRCFPRSGHCVPWSSFRNTSFLTRDDRGDMGD